MDISLPYLWAGRDRRGCRVLYVRRNGKYARLKERPGSPEFFAAYHAACARLGVGADKPERSGRQPFPRGTLGWLGVQYFKSEEFKALDPKSQKNRRGVLEECFRKPHKDDDPEPMGFCPLTSLAARHIQRLRDIKVAAGLKGAANNRRKYLSAMCAWAVDGAKPPLLRSNPCRDVKRVKHVTEGFHTWSLEEIAKFEARWPVGTKPRLALALLLFTGARREDMVTLGRQHVSGGWLRYSPKKMLYRRARQSEKPWLPCLAAIVEQSPCGDLTFLITEYGKPFSEAGFGNWFREQCNAAGLPQCTAHGLRKAGATLLADEGATVHQLMAIYDWDSLSVAEKYTRAANRKRLAGEALPLLARTK
jgi:integrase